MSDFGQPPGGGGSGQPPQGGGGGGFGPPPQGGGGGGGGGGFGQPPQGGGFGQPPGPPGGHGYGAPQQGFGGPQQQGYGGQPPSDYKTAGILMLISGIMNVIAALTWVFVLIWICVGVFWFAMLGVAIFEIVVAATIMQGRAHQQAKTASILGIVASALNANVISLVLEIVAVVMLSKPEVDHYLATNR